MKEYALTINLVDDAAKIEQYKAFHRAVWPEVQECLKAVGIQQMDIYLLGRRLFMYLATEDEFNPARDFGKLLTMHPRYKEWQDLYGHVAGAAPRSAAWRAVGRHGAGISSDVGATRQVHPTRTMYMPIVEGHGEN